MKIELKKIQVDERMSNETTAFSADIYINNSKAGMAYNHGIGGPTTYTGYNESGNKLIHEAEAWCEKLPDRVYEDIVMDGKPLTVKMNLENYIDDLLDEHLKQKDILKFRKEMEIDMMKGIVVGIPDKEYGVIKLKWPLTVLLVGNHEHAYIENIIKEKIIPQLKEGYQILNTNLPADMMQRLGIEGKKQETKQNQEPAKQKQSKSHRHKNR